ncbi:F0F1 ATP synthase subunit delta [Microbacterium deminutum]|uniref:ATP synthase subunit delta n=1 Tax=Microbacterium deminutum TaxID=344164 RepID=A0ABP5BK56_9MICO
MGSATTQALATSTAALEAASGVDLDTARELFAAARIVGDSPQLSGALADPAAAAAARSRVIADVFGAAFGKTTVDLLTTAVEQRWSSAPQLIDGLEELAVRAAAISAPSVDVDGELFGVVRLIADNPELELALGSRLGDESAKGALTDALLDGHASAATTLIVSSLVQQPRDRRVRPLLSHAMDIVADQRGSIVATVHTATPLSAAQSERLSAVLSKRYGKQIGLNAVIDPSVVGGLRVQIADDVIDASVAARLTELRQRLAG